MSIATLAFLLVFGSVGAWFGWRYSTMAIITDTAPRWRRRHGVGRRAHAHSVRRRRQLWRLTTTATSSFIGACVGYVAVFFAPMLRM